MWKRRNCWCVDKGETVGVWIKEKLLVCGKRTCVEKGETVDVWKKEKLLVYGRKRKLLVYGRKRNCWCMEEKLLVYGRKRNCWCMEERETVGVWKKEMCGKRRWVVKGGTVSVWKQEELSVCANRRNCQCVQTGGTVGVCRAPTKKINVKIPESGLMRQTKSERGIFTQKTMATG